MGVHQFEIRPGAHVGTFALSHRRPVFIEELDVASVGLVVRFGFEQIEEANREIQHVFSAGRQVELADGIGCKRLAVEMLSGP